MSADKTDTAAGGPADDAEDGKAKFKRTLVRVLAMQVVALALLGLLQYMFRP
jgi:hypothetical protein